MKVFFQDKFYEAPEGKTAMQFCANCTLTHDGCTGCPWTMVDMSKAIEITDDSISKEECANYINTDPQPGKFYYSTSLANWDGKDKPRRCLIYCEGTKLDDNRYCGISFDNYVSGYGNVLKTLVAELHDEYFTGNFSKYFHNDEERYDAVLHHILCETGMGFSFHKNHLDIEIPKNVWDECVELMKVFNAESYELIKNTRSIVNDNDYTQGHYYFKETKYELTSPDIVDNITYVKYEPKTFFNDNNIYADCIKFYYYQHYGKDCNILSQTKINNYQYEIPEDTVNIIIDKLKQVDNNINNIIKEYIK